MKFIIEVLIQTEGKFADQQYIDFYIFTNRQTYNRYIINTETMKVEKFYQIIKITRSENSVKYNNIGRITSRDEIKILSKENTCYNLLKLFYIIFV